MSLYSRLDRLAADVQRLDRQVTAVSNSPQAQRTSIEAGTMDVNDEDGNLVSTIGLQEDGSGATRFFDGPIPPKPAGFTATADGPIIQGTWDGTFEDGAQATYDLAYLEFAATLVDDDSRVAFATITAKEGASASVVANQTGTWAVAVRSVSQAGRKSEFATAGTVEVKLTDVAGAIEAVQDSANGKNKVNYSDRPPTPEDPGIFDDTWFVGQVGRPNDVVEATNYATNPSLEASDADWSPYSWAGSGVRTQGQGAVGEWFYRLAAGGTQTGNRGRYRDHPASVSAGDTWTASVSVRPSKTVTMRSRGEFRDGSGVVGSHTYGALIECPANEWTRISVSLEAPAAATVVRHQIYLNNETFYSGDTLDLDGEMIALGELSPYFDGDTPSGVTPNESHYRWTGTPHASTSEKYLPALDIGDSDNWNVIEQYRHDGTGWVKVELSHYVFSTVDLGKATVGELDGIRIKARSMSSEVFEGNAFNGYVFTGSIFRTTNGSEFSDNGLFMYDQDGTPRIQAPVDGSDFTINAEIIARSMTAVGRASFLSDNNRLEPGAGLVLAAGVGDPPSPPVVSTYYPTIKAPLQDTDRGAYGLAWADGHFWRWVENENTTGNRGRLEKITTDGDIVASFNTGDFLARNGVVGIGTELFLLGPKTGMNDRRWVQVYGLDGTHKREWEYPHYYATSKYEPGIGRDEDGNVVIAHCWSADGALTWRTFNPNSGAQTAQFDSPDKTKSDISGIYVGAGDFGAKRAVIAKVSGSGQFRQFPAFTTTSGDYVVNDSWYSPGREVPLGVTWDGEKFYSMNSSGVISEYSTLSTGGDGLSSDWWAVYRWATTEDGVIDRRSRISPPARFPWPRRARLRVSAPNLPEGADSIAPSLAYKTSTPSRTDFHSPEWWYTEGEPSAYYYTLPADWATASTPADGNNFPDGDPSVLSAASGLFEVKGDGSGRWGPLTFNPDGTMSSTAIPDWVPVTTFLNSATVQTFGYAPAYRIWPDGKVEWRGVIKFPDTSSTLELLTVPTVARPASDVHVAAAAQSPSTGPARLDVCDPNSPTTIRVVPSASKNWVSLDGLYYYLT